MKKIIIVLFLIVIMSSIAAAYDSGQIEIEDDIVSNCDEFSPCSHWEDYDAFGSESCIVATGCTLGPGGWFVINNTPAVVPAGASCNITVNITGTAANSENLTVEINGVSQTLPDYDAETIVTFPSTFPFTGGYDGSDQINFSGPNDAVTVGWYSIQCQDTPEIPEFSFATITIGFIAVAGGLFIIRKKIK